jgi:uncharacterized membrane protein YidH (DUF202 family)
MTGIEIHAVFGTSTVTQASATIAGATTAGGLTCVGFGMLALVLAAWSLVESTHDPVQRRHYQQLLRGTVLAIAVLCCIIISASLGLWPRWTVGVAFACCFIIGVPTLIWFNSQIRALATRSS